MNSGKGIGIKFSYNQLKKAEKCGPLNEYRETQYRTSESYAVQKKVGDNIHQGKTHFHAKRLA